MPRIQTQYNQVKSKIRPGDVIAFSGDSTMSGVVKWTTSSQVSHVAVVLEAGLLPGKKNEPECDVIIMESTPAYQDPETQKIVNGVQRNQLQPRIETYDGRMWWLPLNRGNHNKLHLKGFADFLLEAEGKDFDMIQSIRSGIDLTDNVPLLEILTHAAEDFSEFFCSELVAGAFRAAGLIEKINPSEVTPHDVCRFNLFEEDYYQIKGRPKKIARFNTECPEGFAV